MLSKKKYNWLLRCSHINIISQAKRSIVYNVAMYKAQKSVTYKLSSFLFVNMANPLDQLQPVAKSA